MIGANGFNLPSERAEAVAKIVHHWRVAYARDSDVRNENLRAHRNREEYN